MHRQLCSQVDGPVLQGGVSALSAQFRRPDTRPCPARWMPHTVADRMSPSTGPRYLTEREVARHRTKDSCWVLLGTRVYDVTAFLRMHPGGEALILRRSGEDVSRAMDGPPHRHSENARRWMEQYYIGELRGESGGGVDEVTQVSRSAPAANSVERALISAGRRFCGS